MIREVGYPFLMGLLAVIGIWGTAITYKAILGYDPPNTEIAIITIGGMAGGIAGTRTVTHAYSATRTSVAAMQYTGQATVPNPPEPGEPR